MRQNQLNLSYRLVFQTIYFSITGGINEYIDETIDATGASDKERLQKIIDALDSVQGIQNFQGEFANMLVCTVRAKSRISALAAPYTTGAPTVVTIKEIGFRVEVIRTTYGDIPVMVDPLMTEIFQNANIGFVMNPKLIDIVSTAVLPSNKQKGANDSEAATKLTGIIFHKDETGSKQPNSPAVMNAYTNLGFRFNGSSVGMYKKLINLGE